jgi:tetratricopeptide (TPR) repeat protein
MERAMKKTYLLTIILLLTAANVIAQHITEGQPAKLNLTADEWRADLRFFAEELPKRHKNAFHTMTRDEFDAAVKQLNEDIPRLKSEEILVRFMKLIAMVGDGHTSIQESALFGFGFFPVRYEIYADGLFVQSAAAEYKDAVGGRFVKIGNAAVEKAVAQLDELAWGDNRNVQSKKVETAFLLSIPKVLQGLKIADGDEAVSLTVEKNGVQKTLEIKAVKDLTSYLRNGKKSSANDDAAAPLPFYLRETDNNFRFEYLRDDKILYVQFNSVENKPDETVAAFFQRVFEFADQNPVEKFVLDLRLNTGGNNQLNKPIVVGLIKSKLNERGRLFVIIGRRTFSAAQNLVNEIEKYTEAIFVGEPTGSSPNLYGDPAVMTLPNSRMGFRVATLWHQTDARDTRRWTAPDIFTELTSDDFRNNRDPAFQSILEYAPGKTFKDIAAEMNATRDLTAFLIKYKAFKADPKNKFANTESQMNALGYGLLQAQQTAAAIGVFRLNAEAYPNSANAFDSLAEAYLAGGNRAEAIKNYEKALRINPNFQSSIEALRKLKG